MTVHVYPSAIDPAALIAEVRRRVGENEGQVSMGELAKRIGHTRGFVSQILSGKEVAAGGRHQTRAKALLLAMGVGLVTLDANVLERVRAQVAKDEA